MSAILDSLIYDLGSGAESGFGEFLPLAFGLAALTAKRKFLKIIHTVNQLISRLRKHILSNSCSILPKL